jgi:uncharacterized protein (DUF433 family)
MPRKRVVILATAALAVGAAGAAIATTTGRDDPKKTEQAVLDSAAKRLNVTPEQLRDALTSAENEQIDQAVKDGQLTKEQADAIKAARKDSGRVLGFGPRGGFGPHRFGPGGPGFGHGPDGPGLPGMRFGIFDAVASALGIDRAELMQQLRAGKSVADLAKAHDKSLADVRSAVRAAAKKQLDAAVKAGRLTQDQENRILDRIAGGLDHFGQHRFDGHRFDEHRGPGF